ncbi:hypothetical protein D9M68_337790 [compost metagenome]
MTTRPRLPLHLQWAEAALRYIRTARRVLHEVERRQGWPEKAARHHQLAEQRRRRQS